MSNTKNSLYLSDDLQAYVEKECEAFGMGKSAFISMVLTFYRQQTNAMNEMSKLDVYMTRLEKILSENKQVNSQVKCSCYKCGKEVPASVEEHFTSFDGKILCDECSKGVEPCNNDLKSILIASEHEK